MANGMYELFSPNARKKPEVTPLSPLQLQWESDQLVFVVREPFVSKTSGAEIVGGTVTTEFPLLIESEMADGGVIFSDGIEIDFLPFNSGTIAKIALAKKKTQLVVG
jgi:hypothetical protein